MSTSKNRISVMSKRWMTRSRSEVLRPIGGREKQVMTAGREGALRMRKEVMDRGAVEVLHIMDHLADI